MNKEEVELRIKYLENYIDLIYRSIDEGEEELQLLRNYMETEDFKEQDN